MARSLLQILAFSAGVALASVPAHATLIMGPGSLAGANPIYLPAVNATGTGPQVLGGVTWTSNRSASLFGWTGGYTFGNGTVAPGDPPIIALNTPNEASYVSMTLTFDTPTSGFLAELFWTNGINGNSTIMAAYDVDGNLLYNTEWSPADPRGRYYYWAFDNNGSTSFGLPQGYYGFNYASAAIKTVTFNNAFMGARNLSYVGPTIGTPPGGGLVPEPATWAMLIFGFGAVGVALRARRSRKQLSFA